MRRASLLSVALTAICLAVGVGGTAPAAAGTANEPDQNYLPYARVRETLLSCSLDRTWHHLSSSQRRRCARYRKLYVLYSAPGESGFFHVHCKTRKCPRTPIGEPNARGPLPSDAKIHRF